VNAIGPGNQTQHIDSSTYQHSPGYDCIVAASLATAAAGWQPGIWRVKLTWRGLSNPNPLDCDQKE